MKIILEYQQKWLFIDTLINAESAWRIPPQYSTQGRVTRLRSINLMTRLPLGLGYKALVFASITNLELGPRFARIWCWKLSMSEPKKLFLILQKQNNYCCVCSMMNLVLVGIWFHVKYFCLSAGCVNLENQIRDKKSGKWMVTWQGGPTDVV